MLLLILISLLFRRTLAAYQVTPDHSIDELKQRIKNLPWNLDSTLFVSKTNEKGFFDWDLYGRWRFFPWDEYRHYPGQTHSLKVPPPLPKYVEGSNQMIDPEKTPDYRVPEPPYRAVDTNYKYFEEDRYYRISPMYLQLVGRWHYHNKHEEASSLGCYCVTVFRRLTPLGMCAILTLRHVLTTASSTDLILRRPRYRRKKTMVNILGFWYETDTWKRYYENASYYGSPARITYHPQWISPDHVNRSHPFPTNYDLSVWATTYQLINPSTAKGFYAFIGVYQRTTVCNRCSGTTSYPYDSPGLQPDDLTILVGAQFVMDIGRYPFPWFKYAIRTKAGKRNPCPKTEWGWFHCIEMTIQVGKLGHESGGILHVVYKKDSWKKRYSGLAGINSFSMRLRSKYLVNYYTVIERHPVLDYFYSAYMGTVPYVFKDYRFDDTKWKGGVYLNKHFEQMFRQNDYYYYYDPQPENVSYQHSKQCWVPYSPINLMIKALYFFGTPYVPIWW